MTQSLALEFKPVTRNDIPLMNHLMVEGKRYWGYPETGLKAFEQAFCLTDETYKKVVMGFIMQQASHPVGYYLFMNREGAVELDQFMLDTSQIGKGWGRRMWEHCVAQAKERGLESFDFWADPNAESFYKHMGAQTIGTRPMVTMPGEVAPIMGYRL